MLHLIARAIPPPLHRAAYRLAHTLRKAWWRVRRPRLNACRVLAFDRAGRVLLVRHSYGSRRWMPPGGSIGRGEDPGAGAARELREETGCRLDNVRVLMRLEEVLHGARNGVHLVAGETADAPVPDGCEVTNVRFFAPDALPDDMPAALRAAMPGWITAATADRRVADRPAPSPPPPSPAPTA